MTITGSGQISFYDINIELGRSGTSTISIDTAENGGYGAINECSSPFPDATNPAAISEWYSYNHNATATLISGSGFDRSASSCAAACALNQVCDNVLYYNTAKTAVFIDGTCQDYQVSGYYADCSRVNCFTIGSLGQVTSIVACSSTTTTTTTTQGACYPAGASCTSAFECCSFVCFMGVCGNEE